MRAWDEGKEEILNALPVPDRRRQRRAPEPIAVEARLHWASGWETVRTTARGWTRTDVLVIVDDSRSQLRGVWIPATDVRRVSGERSGPPPHTRQA